MKVIVLLVSSVLVLSSCGGPRALTDSDSQAEEPVGQTLPSDTDSTDSPDTSDSSAPEDDGTAIDETQTETDEGNTPESEPQEPEEPEIDPACDVDGDGYLNAGCNGDDCDDENAFNHPGQVEICDFDDNDCIDGINDAIECVVYAHDFGTLFEVDPFLGTIEEVTSVPGLFDFDTSLDGTLYGLTPSSFYVFDDTDSTWNYLGPMSAPSGTPNGFAIDSSGTGYATAGNYVYRVNITTGETTLVGQMGGGFSSSGDCVVDKADGLYMTSSGLGSDDLVQINRETGIGTLIGSTGVSSIYGLTAAWGFMFGFTGGGQVALIDPQTAEGQVLHSFSGYSFYGAASSPLR